MGCRQLKLKTAEDGERELKTTYCTCSSNSLLLNFLLPQSPRIPTATIQRPSPLNFSSVASLFAMLHTPLVVTNGKSTRRLFSFYFTLILLYSCPVWVYCGWCTILKEYRLFSLKFDPLQDVYLIVYTYSNIYLVIKEEFCSLCRCLACSIVLPCCSKHRCGIHQWYRSSVPVCWEVKNKKGTMCITKETRTTVWFFLYFHLSFLPFTLIGEVWLLAAVGCGYTHLYGTRLLTSLLLKWEKRG